MNRDVMRAREITAETARRELDRLRSNPSLSETELSEIVDRIEYAIQLLERIPADVRD
jgi:hypothetical protein